MPPFYLLLLKNFLVWPPYESTARHCHYIRKKKAGSAMRLSMPLVGALRNRRSTLPISCRWAMIRMPPRCLPAIHPPLRIEIPPRHLPKQLRGARRQLHAAHRACPTCMDYERTKPSMQDSSSASVHVHVLGVLGIAVVVRGVG